ncbi:MAG: hypothetical protein ABIA97_01890 [Candidatus Omnitrophota bacterium]
MGRKILAEKEEFEKAVGIKGTFSGSFLSLLKFVISLILLPLVTGVSKGFFLGIIKQPQYIRNNFIFAVGLYLIVHLFILAPKNLYDLGQRIIGRLFSFFVPLRRVMYYSLSFYSSLFFILFLIFRALFGYNDTIGYFMFLISFSAVMHLVITSEYLKSESQSAIKGDYFLSLTFVYLFGIILFCGFLNVMAKNFSFLEPIQYGYKFFVDTHVTIWKQFFVVR